MYRLRAIILSLPVLFALASACQRQDAPTKAFEHALKYSGFSPGWIERIEITNTAQLVRIEGSLPQLHGDTSDYFAWRFEFKDVSLGSEDIARDYEVFIDTTTGYLLEIRSPVSGDCVYVYNRDREGYPAISEGRVPDSGIITFVEALKACTYADPLTAKRIEATTVYGGPAGRSPRHWEIVAYDAIYNGRLFHSIPRLSDEAFRELEKRSGRRGNVHDVTQWVSAVGDGRTSMRLGGYDRGK